MVDQTERTTGATLRGSVPYVQTPEVDLELPEITSDGINPLTGQPYITPNTEIMGAGTPEPYEPDIPVERTPASKLSSFNAGVGSMTREYYRGALETFMFEPDPQYNKDADLANFEKTMGLRDGELDQFSRAKSKEQFQHIVDTVLGNRERNERMGDNFWSGLAGSFLDIDTVAGVLGGGVGAGASAAGKVSRAGRAAIAAGTAAGTTAGVVALGGDNTSLDNTDHVINVVSAGLGGWFATTPMRNLDAAIDAERAAVRGAEPSDTTTGTPAPIQTEVHTEVTPPEVQTSDVLEEAIKLQRETWDSLERNYDNVEINRKIVLDALEPLAKPLRVPPKSEDTVSGSLAVVHGSKVKDLTFRSDWDATKNLEDKSYFDNVFGDDVVYVAEDAIWTPRTPEEAADMRMPFYENVYDVDVAFNKAFVLTPDSAPRLGVLLKGSTNDSDIVPTLRALGYDGLIIRDMPTDYEAVDAISTLSGLTDHILQNQIVVFKPDTLKVLGEASGRQLGGELVPTGTIPPVTQRTLPDEQPATPRAPFSDYATKTQENKGKRTVRVIEDAPDSRFQAKYRYTDDGLTVESVQVQKGLDDKRIRMDAYEYGIRLANEQGVPFKVNPNEQQVIKSLQGLGYNVQDGIVQGTKTFDGSSTRTVTSTQAAKVELTSEQVQNLANEVLPEVLKVDDEIASIPLDNVAGVPKGTNIPLSRPLVDKDGNQLMPKGSIERMWQAQIQSAYDLLIHYTKDPNNPLMKLLASPYNVGDDAPSAASALQRRGDTMLAEVELALNEATKELHGTSSVWGRLGAKSHTAAFKQTSMDMYEGLQRLDQHVIEQASNGTVLSQDDIIKLVDNLTYPEPIKKAIRTYLSSGFAAFHHSNLGRGVVDEDTIGAILQRSTYAPVAHNYERIRNFINKGADDAERTIRETRVQQFLGNQIADMYQALRNGITTSKGVVRMSPEDLGKRFLKNAEVRARSPNTIRTLGVPRDDVVDMLVDQGVPLDEAKQLSVTITDYSAKQRGFSNTRRRISWDWGARMPMPDGSTFGMRDLVDDNPIAVLQDYNRRVSKRTALAKYGFGNREALETAKHEMLNALPEGVDKAKATKFIDDTISASLGNPIGESLPMTIRSLQTGAGSILLAWSGLYQGVEAATQVVKLGVVRNFPHILSAGKPVFKGMKGYTVSEADTVEKALTGQLMSPDRWRNIFTHLSDDFDVTSKFHEAVQYFGQSTKFLNASEFVKRWQIGAYASVVTKAFGGAVRGSTSDLKFLRDKLRMSDELIDAIKTEYKAHGDNINAWDVDTRLAMEQKVLHEGDNVALQIHHGEVPDFLEYTAWGKMIFPFMRFVWGAHNKLLRGTYIRDGALGVAMVLAVQIPLAMAVAQLKQMSAGKEPFDMDKPEDVKEWVRGTVTAMSGLGIFSIPMDIILSEGRNMGSVAVFAPVTKTYGLVSSLASEDGASVRDFKENTLLNTPLPMSLLMIAFEEDE